MSKQNLHIVINAKGGVGKSFISALLLEYLTEKSNAIGIDTDPNNHSLSDIESLPARIKTIVEEEESNKKLLNRYRRILVERILNEIEEYLEKSGRTYYMYEDELSDPEFIKELLMKASEKYPGIMVAAIYVSGNIVRYEVSLGKDVAKTFDARNIVSKLKEITSSKGGGRRDHVSGVIEASFKEAARALEDALKWASKEKLEKS